MVDTVEQRDTGTLAGADGIGALPQVFGPTFGRDRDIERAVELVRGRRRPVLSIVGPGGVGKTRLVIELGEALRRDFPDGVIFVGLAGERTGGDAVPRIARSTGDGMAPAAGVRSWLESRSVLLILDNLEQIADAGRLVAELAPASGLSQVVVTSRGPLHIAAEQVLRLDPLAVEGIDPQPGPAVALFIEIARLADADYHPGPDETRSIAELCRRLDGLPLAIQLAAQRRRLIGVTAMLRRIDEDPALLATVSPDVDDRQRTVERSIRWSMDLLSGRELADAHLISLAPAGWAEDALSAVRPPIPLATLERLLDLGLLRRDDDRLGMLQTVRDVVSSAGDVNSDRSWRRLVDAWREIADRLGGETAGPAVLREDANLRVVVERLRQTGDAEGLLRFVRSLDRYWIKSGTAGTIAPALRWALGSADVLPVADQLPLLHLACLASGLAGETEAAMPLAARVLELADTHGTVQERLWARNVVGGVHAMAGRFEQAYDTYVAALALEAEGADVTKVLVNLAGTAMSLRRDEEAVRFLARANQHAAHPDGVARHPVTQMHLAELATRSGDVAAARRHLVDALHHAGEMQERLWQVGAVVITAGLVLSAGDEETAAGLMAATEALLERERIGINVVCDEHEIARFAQLRNRVGAQRWRELRTRCAGDALPALVAAALEWLESAGDEDGGPLTAREREIAVMIAAGRSNREIADELYLSPRTVQTHVANMLRKLELPSRSALAAWQATATTTGR